MNNYYLRSIAIALFLILNVTLNSQNYITIGDGQIVNTNTTFPSPYGNYYKGSKEQYLIRASEFYNGGISSGNILSIAFDVTAANGVPLIGYEVKIGTTQDTVLDNFLTGLTTVYSSTSYTDTLGWNTYQFSLPFIYNGIDNIVIEVCFNNSDYTNNGIVNQTATSFVSTRNYHADAEGVCTNTSVGTGFSQRPNIRFAFAPNAVIDAGVYSISSPTFPSAPGNYPINAKLLNYGISTLTSATINWSVNGVLQTPYSWSDTLTSTSSTSTLNIGNYTFPVGYSTIKVWSSLPNSQTDSFAYNDTAVFTMNFQYPLNGTYTIGSSQNNDFTDFHAAIDALNAGGIDGPVVFNVDSGVYAGNISIPLIPGLSDTNTIVFQSTSGDTADVKLGYSSSSVSDNYVIKFDGAKYITFKNITIIANGSTYANAIVFNGSENINLEGNLITSSMSSSSSTSSGIYTSTSVGNNINIINNTFIGGYYGIYLKGQSSYI